MTAAEIAQALGGRREGCSFRCPCPVQRGHSLIVTERRGKTLFNCRAGCGQAEVLSALGNLGLFGGRRIDLDRISSAERKRREGAEFKAEIERLRRQIDWARALYRRAIPAVGTPVEVYLRARGITLPLPECLRFLQHCPHRNGKYYPEMVAPVVGVTGHQIASHKTFLTPDGSSKADLPPELQRECCGPVGGGAVRLAAPRAGLELIVGEGLESALSAIQLFELPGWAALSAPGLSALELPPAVQSVLICADHDHNAVGLQAALDAKIRWVNEDRALRIRWPRIVSADFNDVLQGEVR
jgi:hypothetical protein